MIWRAREKKKTFLSKTIEKIEVTTEPTFNPKVVITMKNLHASYNRNVMSNKIRLYKKI